MGAVFVAEQLSTRAERALKLMHPQLVRDPALRARFEQEAKVAAQIPSDHVVQVIGAGVDGETGMPWLAMELLDGSDLVEASATGRCGATRLEEIMEQLCHGLGAAHDQGVVHRDLKPENVFIAAPRRPGVPFTVKILDFGIAKVTEQARSSAATAALGTPLWMAPEQAGAASGVISPATDIWALGLIAFWLLTGRAYWKGAQDAGITLQTLMREVLFDPLVPASRRAVELGYKGPLPACFDEWFARTVVRDPAQRYPDARTAFQALSRGLAGPIASGIGFADAATAVADANATAASRPSVPKTIDDQPPLRLATQPAPTQLAPHAAPPTVAALPFAPAASLSPAAPLALPPTGGFGYSASPSAPTPPRPSGVGRALWALATLAVLAFGVAAALVITREDWKPYLDAAVDPVPPPTASPIPTTSITKIVCPDGSRASGDRCVPHVDRSCPTGMRFVTDRGCVAIVADPPAPPAAAGQPQPTLRAPTMQTGMLTVVCSPVCDSVTVDGVNVGRSPLVNRALPSGTHALVLRRTGYTTLHASAVIVAGKTTARRYTLSPTPSPSKTPDKQ